MPYLLSKKPVFSVEMGVLEGQFLGVDARHAGGHQFKSDTAHCHKSLLNKKLVRTFSLSTTPKTP